MSQNDPCAIATMYADKMSKCSNMTELRALGAEIKSNLDKVVGFHDWLRDWFISCSTTLNTPDTPFESTLNSLGKKKFLKGESLEC